MSDPDFILFFMFIPEHDQSVKHIHQYRMHFINISANIFLLNGLTISFWISLLRPCSKLRIKSVFCQIIQGIIAELQINPIFRSAFWKDFPTES